MLLFIFHKWREGLIVNLLKKRCMIRKSQVITETVRYFFVVGKRYLTIDFKALALCERQVGFRNNRSCIDFFTLIR